MSSRKRKASGEGQPPAEAKQAAQPADILIPTEFCDSKAWDTNAEVLPASKARTALLSGLFDTSTFCKILKSCEKQDPLEFGRDLNAARYEGGVRETPNAEVADSKTVWGLYKQGCTLQVHQPQRFHPPLAAVCSGLEQRLGCLVGINAYLTPSSIQGLAPHHDDVEVFVCQTEGTKRWRLYNYRNGFAKPSQPSGDLAEDTLGEPIMDVTLKTGDVLYMPRGTIHQAVAQEGASSHLTISTYQNFTFGTLAQAMLHSAMQGQEEPICLPLSLRHSLPPGFLFSHGFQADKVQEAEAVMLNPLTPPQRGSLDDQSRQVRQKVAAGLRDLAQRIEQQPELLSKAADLMSLDFMDNRAPPPEANLLLAGPEPTMMDSVLCRGKNAFRLVQFEGPEGDMDTDLVKIISCLSNSIEDHMMGREDDHDHQHGDDCCHDNSRSHAADGQAGLGVQHEDLVSSDEQDDESGEESEIDEDDSGLADLVFPAMYSPALAQLLGAHSRPVRMTDISLDADEVKLDLASTLWKEGILAVRPEVGRPKIAKKGET